MKKTMFVLFFCVLSIPAIAADEAIASQAQVESLIASTPTPKQFEVWELASKQQKTNPVKELPVDMTAVKANCRKLEALRNH